MKTTFISQNKNALIFLVALMLCALRFIHLGADTPIEVSKNIGIYVDEGYKTIGPRNLVLFGTEHWNPKDDYPGWTSESPLTQLCYYASFLILGPSIQSARIVTILFFTIFLLLYISRKSHTYPYDILLIGALLLGLQSTLFFYSRVALFEIPIIVAVYWSIFELSGRSGLKLSSLLAIIFVPGAIAFFLIKKTVLIYFTGILLGTMFTFWYNKDNLRRSSFIKMVVFSTVFLVALYRLSYNAWHPMLDLSLGTILYRINDFPLLTNSPPLIIAGLTCAIHGLITSRNSYLSNPYRMSLLSMSFVCPLLLSLLHKNPLRYYVPLIPAYVLIVIDWIHTNNSQTTPRDDTRTTVRFLVISIFITTALLVSRCFYQDNTDIFASLANTPLYILVLLSISASLYILLKFDMRTRMMFSYVMLFMILAWDVASISRLIVRPSHESSNIRSDIIKLIPAGTSIAGDWAPYFTLNTDIKSLYTNDIYNNPARVSEVAPDYFLYSDFYESEKYVAELKLNGRAEIGESIYDSTYIGIPLSLHRVAYNNL